MSLNMKRLIFFITGIIVGSVGMQLLSRYAIAAPPNLNLPEPLNINSLTKHPTPTVKPGEVLVKFKSTTSASTANNVISLLGGTSHRVIGKNLKVHVVKLPVGTSVEDAVKSFSADPNVEYAQPNYIYRINAVPNDSSFDQEWGLKNTSQMIPDPSYPTNNPGLSGADIDAELAWEQTSDCSGVVVAVIDTGVNYAHSDLASNMWNGNANHGYDFVDNDNDPLPSNAIHGTHVAGTIGAQGNNSVGTSGVCWDVQIMSLRVLGPDGSGVTSDIIPAIEFAADNGADVINMSLGGGGGFDQLYFDSIEYAGNNDVVVVVAAGNDNSDNELTPQWPCNFSNPNLICVAALDQAYQRADFSNWGATSVDIGGPGTNILSTWPGETVAVSDYGDFLVDTPSGSAWGALSAADTCITAGSDPIATLTNPTNWCSGGSYANDTSAVAWHQYDLSNALNAGLSLYAFLDTEYDTVNGKYDLFAGLASPTGGNPFSGDVLFAYGGSTGGGAFRIASDLSNCLTSACTIGYALFSDASVTGQGVAVVLMEVQKIENGSTVYEKINGTSMATPHVTGVVALVRAFNPNYNALDAVRAVLAGGEPNAALQGLTTTGDSVNALGALAYIRAPTGVQVSGVGN